MFVTIFPKHPKIINWQKNDKSQFFHLSVLPQKGFLKVCRLFKAIKGSANEVYLNRKQIDLFKYAVLVLFFQKWLGC